MYLSLHCHHQNDSCVKMSSDQSHFNVSLIVRDKVTRQCPQTTTCEEKGEPKQIRTEVHLLTSLKPVLNWANVCSQTWLGVFGEPSWFLTGRTFASRTWLGSIRRTATKLYSGVQKALLSSTCSGNIRPIRRSLPLTG